MHPGETPIKNNAGAIYHTGEIPITKNIQVVDSFMRSYAPTHLRRAKGLVKAGRARWSDESKTEICLLVSPVQAIEGDNEMDIYDNDGNKATIEDPLETAKTDDDNRVVLTVNYILAQMEKIRSDNGYIYEALKQVQDIQTYAPTMNASDLGSSAKAEAVGDIIKSREATNQKLLTMYEQMYNDIKPVKVDTSISEKEKMLKWASEMVASNDLFGQSFGNQFGSIFKEMFK